MQKHLYQSYSPLLEYRGYWMRMSPSKLYCHQEGATVGYNPHKPGRPSHTYHTYMIANVRLIWRLKSKQATGVHPLIQPLDYGNCSSAFPVRIGRPLFGAILIGEATR